MSLRVGDVVHGAYVIDRRMGRVETYAGRRLADGCPVLISLVPRCEAPIADLRGRFTYAVPGVTELIFLGEMAHPLSTGDAPTVILVERLPDGDSLSRLALPLASEAAFSFGRDLCDVAIAARDRGISLVGVSPALTFCRVHGTGLRLTSVAPRSTVFLASPQRGGAKTMDGPDAFEQPDLYVMPEIIDDTQDLDRSNAYLVGLLLGYAALGRHPFAKWDGEVHQFELMTMGRHVSLEPTGALAPVLDAVLVADPARRVGLDALASSLRGRSGRG